MAKKFLHSNIVGEKPEVIIKTRMIQTLACTLSSFHIDEMTCLYEMCGYDPEDAEKDLHYLYDSEIIDGLLPRPLKTDYLAWYSLHFSPHSHLDILRGIDEKDVEGILDMIDSMHYEHQWNISALYLRQARPILRALIPFLQGRDWTEWMPGCVEVLNSKSFYIEECVLNLLIALMDDPANKPFFEKLPSNIMNSLLGEKTRRYINMNEIDTEQKSRAYYFDKDNQPIYVFHAVAYVLQNELLVNGHIDQLIEKYSHWPFMLQLLKAVKDLHNGNTKPMFTLAKKMIREKQIEEFTIPIFTTWIGAAMMMDTTPDSQALATKIYNNKLLKDSIALLRTLVLFKIKGEMTIYATEITLQNPKYHDSQIACFTLIALHYQIFTTENKPSEVKMCEENMVDSKHHYLQMLLAQESKLLENKAEELQAITGMKPFFPKVEHKEDWEIKLDKLIDKTLRTIVPNDPTAKNIQGPTQRIAYLLNPQDTIVQPVLQTTNNNGATWTKGRKIAMQKFATGRIEGATNFDRQIAELVSVNTSYWYSKEYTLYGNDVIAALAGHPYIYTNDDNRLKIDITLEPLQLSVTNTTNNAFTFKTNVDLEKIETEYYVDTTNPVNWRVVKVDDDQQTLIKQLLELGTLPNKAKDKLSTLMTHFSHTMTVMSDQLNIATQATTIEPSTQTIVQLIPEGEYIRATLYAKPLNDIPPYLTPGKGIETISGKINDKIVQTRRNLKEEQQNLKAVENIIQGYNDTTNNNNVWILDIEQTLTLLDQLSTMTQQACVEWPEGAKLKIVRPQITPNELHLSVHKLNDWFTIDGNIQIDQNTQLKIEQLLQLINLTEGRFIRLNQQEYVALSQELAKHLHNIARLNNNNNKKVQISTFSAQLIDELEQAGVNINADKEYRALIKRITEADTLKIKTPKAIQADLRDYQKEGYKWLTKLIHWGAGACLADDMGLGKTLQTITILYTQRQQGPSLVVAPASVIQNWQDEIERFAPTLNTIILNKNTDTRNETINNAAPNDIIITSYGLLVTEQQLLATKQWNITVLDEAHTIKNRDTKMSKAAMTLQTTARIALTGTPIQNRLAEIWNIFQFLNPGLLGTYQQFNDNFITPIEKNEDKNQQRLLKRIITPFILRRTKNDVLTELPQKTEITIKVNLSNEEQALYENLRQQALLAVESGECNPIQALAELTRLRQAACHPQLIDTRLDIGSSKTETFMQIVNNLHYNHHRALVFSQFTTHLALIRKQLDQANINYLYLDGATPIKQRATLVNQFQTGDTPLFLISLKAGGLGLNLTAADYVIHLDPWWNPAIEDQASDRSYRIGQQKPVTVYRLIATNTIEEKILTMHQHKKSLADALLEGTDMSARLTREEILELLHEIK